MNIADEFKRDYNLEFIVVPEQGGYVIQCGPSVPEHVANAIYDSLEPFMIEPGFTEVSRPDTTSNSAPIPEQTLSEHHDPDILSSPKDYSDDSVVFEVIRPHIDAYKPHLFILVIFIMGTFAVEFIPALDTNNLVRIATRATVISGALYIMMVIFMGLYTQTYFLSDKVIRAKTGLINIQRKELQVRDITAMDVHQSLLQRFLKVGHIYIATSATSGVEMVLENIKSPMEVRLKMRHYLMEV